MTELEAHIQATRLIDTHEHLQKEEKYVNDGLDILGALFAQYTSHDLRTAGISDEAMQRLFNAGDPDIAGRFRGAQAAWEAIQFTGYGEAVRLAARKLYGLTTITPEGLAEAQKTHQAYMKPGERLRILRDIANLDHVQIDDFVWACKPDLSGLDFFLYDLSWAGFASGPPDAQAIQQETGIQVRDLETLRAGMEAIFTKYAPCAIAVKTQHAYNRTLLWQERSDADVTPLLDKSLNGAELSEEERLCLGDWSLARGVELAERHNLPVKIHTGHYAGNGSMPIDRIRPGHLSGLLRKYPKVRFVLMHIGYPYGDELVSLAKHYPNIWVDMCWAWSIDPFSSSDFLRRMIHAVPANKLFVFGGDSGWPFISVGYAIQARRWLTRTLQAEVDAGDITEREAIQLSDRLMRGNQEACFDLVGTRAAIREQSGL